MKKQIVKNTLSLVMMTSLSILLIWLGIKTIKDNYSRDINRIEKVIGQIERTEIIRTKKKAGSPPYTANMNLKFLRIKLKDIEERFYSYNPKQNYSDLINELKIGSEVVVYYERLSDDNIKNNIYRLDLGTNQILEHSEYKEKEYFAGIVMLVFSLFVLMYSGFLLKNKGLKNKWG